MFLKMSFFYSLAMCRFVQVQIPYRKCQFAPRKLDNFAERAACHNSNVVALFSAHFDLNTEGGKMGS